MRNDIIIEKIVQIAEKINHYCAEVTYEEFLDNEMLIEACVFNLSQIGELSNRLDEEFTNSNPHIPWRQLYGLRNRLVHDYEGVNLKLVWEIISEDLPALKLQLEEL